MIAGLALASLASAAQPEMIAEKNGQPTRGIGIMSCPTLAPLQARLSVPETAATTVDRSPIILSFDVEEHWRIEAAAHLTIDPAMKAHCRDRLAPSTQWLLDRLAESDLNATFFILGQIAEHSPKLVRAIQQAGHEVASHGWDHQRLHRLTPAMFRKDVRQSKDALEHVTGTPVLGYRAPTFSLMKETAWAIDVLAEEGFRYDSSIYPIRHDRYGVPGAPRTPFRLLGRAQEILELPPLTWRLLGMK